MNRARGRDVSVQCRGARCLPWIWPRIGCAWLLSSNQANWLARRGGNVESRAFLSWHPSAAWTHLANTVALDLLARALVVGMRAALLELPPGGRSGEGQENRYQQDQGEAPDSEAHPRKLHAARKRGKL